MSGKHVFSRGDTLVRATDNTMQVTISSLVTEGYILDSDEVLELSSQDLWVVTNKRTSVKQDHGKRRMDLLPWSALDSVGDVLTYGKKKYPKPEETWLVNSTQEDISRYRAALVRHLSAKAQGEVFDVESGLPHDAHIATNSLFIIALEKKYGGYDV